MTATLKFKIYFEWLIVLSAQVMTQYIYNNRITPSIKISSNYYFYIFKYISQCILPNNHLIYIYIYNSSLKRLHN